MYQVLYRKYRPKTFDDVYGQPHITSTLLNELRNNRLSHAYLFTGTRGTGKTTCAKILAKAVNCLNPKDGNPCGECEICRAIDSSSLPDVEEIDAASNNGVDNIRGLRDAANYTPALAKYRVYIIDEVHMLSDSAYNALLKTLEEPPEYIIFILATTEIHKVPATILSRCQRFDFHRIPLKDIESRLKVVSKEENISIDDEALNVIAKSADGAMRDALSLLDRCASGDKHITSESAIKTIGTSGQEYLFELTDSIFKKTPTDIINNIDTLYNNSKDMTRLCEELVKHFRDLLLVKLVKNPESILNTTSNDIRNLLNCADGISKANLVRAAEIMQKATQNIKAGSNPRVEVELSLIKISDASVDNSVRAINQRLEKLEQFTKSTHIREDKTFEINQSNDTDFNNIQMNINKVDSNSKEPNKEISVEKSSTNNEQEGAVKQWPEIIQSIKKSAPLLGAQLSNSKAYINGDYLLIDNDNEQFRETLRNNSNMKDIVKSSIFSVLGTHFKIGPYIKDKSNNKENDVLNQFLNDMEQKDVPINYN